MKRARLGPEWGPGAAGGLGACWDPASPGTRKLREAVCPLSCLRGGPQGWNPILARLQHKDEQGGDSTVYSLDEGLPVAKVGPLPQCLALALCVHVCAWGISICLQVPLCNIRTGQRGLLLISNL